MIIVQVCVGSSCHLKGSPEIVALLQKAIEENNLGDDINLCGSFCLGSCTTTGVSVQVEEEICPGITPENFRDFFQDKIMTAVEQDRRR